MKAQGGEPGTGLGSAVVVKPLVWLGAGLFSAHLATASGWENLSASALVGFESDYVFRGGKVAGESIQPSVELGYPIGPGDLFLGVWGNLELSSDPYDEVRGYLGYHQVLTPIVSLASGLTVYQLPEDQPAPDNQEELFVALMADLPFSPSVFAYYNFAMEQILLEGSLAEAWPLTDDLSLEAGLIAGVGYARKAGRSTDEGKQWFGFATTYADLVLTLSDPVTATAGLRYSAREEQGFADVFYWGASLAVWF